MCICPTPAIKEHREECLTGMKQLDTEPKENNRKATETKRNNRKYAKLNKINDQNHGTDNKYYGL